LTKQNLFEFKQNKKETNKNIVGYPQVIVILSSSESPVGHMTEIARSPALFMNHFKTF